MIARTTCLTILAAVLLAYGSVASAGPVTVTVSAPGTSSDKSAPNAAETAFLSRLKPGSATETFEGFTPGVRSNPTPVTPDPGFNTAVGHFMQVTPGSGGLCDTSPMLTGCNKGLAVLDATTSPYSDRYPAAGSNWLDNVGTRLMRFTPNAGVNAVGFFGIDVGDQCGRFLVTIVAGSTIDLGCIFQGAGGPPPSGSIVYIAFEAVHDISQIEFNTDVEAEGYGFDNVTVGRHVPAPASLGMLLAGLVSVGLLRRRRG